MPLTARTIQWGSKGALALLVTKPREKTVGEAGQPDRRYSRVGQYERCIYSRHACKCGSCPTAVGLLEALGVPRDGRRGVEELDDASINHLPA
jgi:hypothetical protein